MSPNQPLPDVAAHRTRRSPQEAARLLRLWGALATRAAAAAAHGLEDEEPLRQLQRQVEEALVRRFPGRRRQLAELTVWEASLLHTGERVAAEQCLICRRARLELPLDLPLPPAANGGRR